MWSPNEYDEYEPVYYAPRDGPSRELKPQDLEYKIINASPSQLEKIYIAEQRKFANRKKWQAGNPVPRLRVQCLEFLSYSTHCSTVTVRMKIKVPKKVGMEIFMKAAEKLKLLEETPETRASLKTFSDVYKENFLTSCSLIGDECFWLLNHYKRSLRIMLKYVAKLELINGKIDENNDILFDISELENLKILNLSGNQISSKGFRKLASYLLNKKTSSKVKYFDISKQIIPTNEMTIQKIMKLPNLENLIVDQNMPESWLQPHFTKIASPCFENVETIGFCSILLSTRSRADLYLLNRNSERNPTSHFLSSDDIRNALRPSVSSSDENRNRNKTMFQRSKTIPNNIIPESLNGKRKINYDKENETQTKKSLMESD